MKLFNTLFKIALTFVLALVGNNSFSQQQTKFVLTTGGSWVVPAGVYAVKVECIGAGGGGGRSSNSGQATGGGGGGAYASKVICVQPYQNVSYQIGQGGQGGSTNNNGTDTWFGGNAASPGVLAKGGKGAAENNVNGGLGGNASDCIGSVAYSGGNGGLGTGKGCGDGSGGGGGAAGTTGNGNNGKPGTTGITSGNGGDGGTAKTNYGGAGGDGTGSNGTGNNAPYDASNYGGGGGGAKKGCSGVTSSHDGGHGANGAIIITLLIKDLSAGEDLTSCEDAPIQLSGTFVTDTSENVSLLWSGGPIMVGETTVHPTVNPSTTTNYVLTASIESCVTTDTVTITVAPKAHVIGDIAVQNLGNLSYAFSANTQFTSSYLWDFGDGQTSTDQAPTHQYANNDAYLVTLTVTNNCGSSSATKIVNTLSTDELVANQLSMFPNPATDVITFENNGNAPFESIVVYDLLGQIKEIKSIDGQMDCQLQLSNYSKGIYLVTIRLQDGKVVRSRFEVQ